MRNKLGLFLEKKKFKIIIIVRYDVKLWNDDVIIIPFNRRTTDCGRAITIIALLSGRVAAGFHSDGNRLCDHRDFGPSIRTVFTITNSAVATSLVSVQDARNYATVSPMTRFRVHLCAARSPWTAGQARRIVAVAPGLRYIIIVSARHRSATGQTAAESEIARPKHTHTHS